MTYRLAETLPYTTSDVVVVARFADDVEVLDRATVAAERKVAARIQNRVGPMMTGPRKLAEFSMWTGGLLQTAADAIKLLVKELIIPSKTDAIPFIAAPVLIVTVCVTAYIVIPFGPAFSVRTEDDRTVAPVLLYPRRGVLASGWLLGEERIADRAAVVDVSMGRGHMVLFGIRPQYRAQSNATFKMLFNGLFYW